MDKLEEGVRARRVQDSNLNKNLTAAQLAAKTISYAQIEKIRVKKRAEMANLISCAVEEKNEWRRRMSL